MNINMNIYVSMIMISMKYEYELIEIIEGRKIQNKTK